MYATPELTDTVLGSVELAGWLPSGFVLGLFLGSSATILVIYPPSGFSDKKNDGVAAKKFDIAERYKTSFIDPLLNTDADTNIAMLELISFGIRGDFRSLISSSGLSKDSKGIRSDQKNPALASALKSKSVSAPVSRRRREPGIWPGSMPPPPTMPTVQEPVSAPCNGS